MGDFTEEMMMELEKTNKLLKALVLAILKDEEGAKKTLKGTDVI